MIKSIKKRGFTLVELLVAISLLAILTVIAIPTLRAFQASNAKKIYENYGKSLITSAKLYNDSYGDDLFGRLENGCEKVTLTEMINKKIAKDITLKDVTCNKPDKDSYVLVWKYKNEYAYDPIVNCENSKGVNQFEDNNEALAEACVTATGKPYITVNTVSNEANNTKKKSVIINLNDDFGFTANQEIQYAWSTVNNDNGTGVTGYKTYKFNNSYIKRTSGTVILKTNSITIPDEATGTYYLYVKPIKVQNIIDESITNIHKFGPYRFDHEPPRCPTIKAYKADGSEVAKETSASINKFKISYSSDDLQNYELKISYDNGSTWSSPTPYTVSVDEYIPTKDGKIKIMTRANDYANNQSDWCTSDVFIRDTTPPNAPTVTGYKKTSATDISSKGNLDVHTSNTWLKGWIFTQASGSGDNSGVNYYYTTTGATTNNSNVKASYRNINAEGESTIKYKACDDAGNCSGWVSYIAKLDRTAPTCGTATGASTDWTNSDRTISVVCSETGGSNCKKSSYSSTYNSGTTTTANITIQDNAGNSRNCSVNVYVDKEAPSCGTVTGASTNWTKENRTISVACSETGGSNCKKSSYSSTYSSGTTKTANIAIQDNAGNSRNCSVNVYVDKEAPSCGTVTGASTNWTKENRTISVACSETGGSNCKKSSYSSTYSSGTTKTANIAIQDNAGNSRNCSVNVYVDKEAPSCGTVTGASTNWTSSNRTISVACSESGGSNCKKTSYSSTYSSGTTKTANIAIQDNAGNSRNCSVNVYVDKDNPTCSIGATGTSGSNSYFRSNASISLTTNPGTGSSISNYGLTTSSTKSYNSKSSDTQTNTTGTKWYGYVKDAAGNEGSCNKTIKVDTTNPVVTFTNNVTQCGNRKHPGNGVTYPQGVASFGWTDTYSGPIDVYMYYKFKKGSKNYCSDFHTQIEGNQQEVHGIWVKYGGPITYKVKICDKAGNCGSKSGTTSCSGTNLVTSSDGASVHAEGTNGYTSCIGNF